MIFLRNTAKLSFLIAGIAYSTFSFGTDPIPSLKFIQNKNQWPANVHFSADIPGGSMIIAPGKFSYYFIDNKKIQELHEQLHNPPPDAELDLNIKGYFVQAKFIGANLSVTPQPFGQSSEYYNYYLGNDPTKWASRAYAYDGMTYPSLYENVDLKIYSSGDNLKYDFIVAPYGDPSQIIYQYEGAESMMLSNGNLYVKTSLGDIIEKRPYAYQNIAGEKVTVECTYNLQGSIVTFCFPKGYDPCYELVIDPLLIFSTYSGSAADNWGSTATPGEQGNLYSSGVTNHFTNSTFSGTFPATPGAFGTTYGGVFDIGILKYDSIGSKLLYAAYLGGNESEFPHSLVMNAEEELIVLGTTSSKNFPTTAGAVDATFNGGQIQEAISGVAYANGSDIIVARISKDGSKLLASTYLGGSSNDGVNPAGGILTKNYGDELRGDITTDAAGDIYLSSVTSSSNFPAQNSFDISYNGGATDALLVKLNRELSQIKWAAFIGGTGVDASHTLRLDQDNSLFIAGGTTSANFPATPGSYKGTLIGNADGWVAKITQDGSSILHATYTGSTSFDQVYFVDLSSNREVYVYGQTSGSIPKIPSTVYNNPNSGQFIQKFDNDLTTLMISTVFGSGRGIPDISPTAFLVNDCNNLYMAGWGGIINSATGHWSSTTVGMPISDDAYQKTTSGSDFYFMVLTDDASRFLYGTYLGGNQSRTHVDGGTSRFDKSGVVYHAVCSGCAALNATSSPTSDFPTTSGAWSRTNKSKNCNNAAFKFDLSSLKARIQTNSVKLNMPGLSVVCIPDKIVFQNFSTGGEIFQWDFGNGIKLTRYDTAAITHQYKAPGQYLVKLKAIDQNTCREVDSTSTIVIVNKSAAKVQDDDKLCSGTTYQLKASGGAFYEWKLKDGTLVSNEQTPTVTPADTTQYFVTVTEANGCIRKDTVKLNVVPGANPEFHFKREGDCSDKPFIRVKNLTDSLLTNDRSFFDFGDGSSSDEIAFDHYYEKEGVYNISAVVVREFCVFEKTVTIPVYKLILPNIITPEGSEGFNDAFTIQYGEVAGVTPANFGFKVSLIVYNRWGTILYETDDYQYNWSGEGLASGVYYYEATVEGHATCKSWLQIVR